MYCNKQFCQNEAAVNYLGFPLCNAHWMEIAEEDLSSEEENVPLAAIGFVRSEGVVVPLVEDDDGQRSLPGSPTISVVPGGA